MTTPTATDPGATRTHHASPSRRANVVRLALHLIGPVLVCLGLGVGYLSAFHHPQPRELKVAIVGTTPETKVMAQTIKDKAGDGLDVITLNTPDQAKAELMHRDLAGAFIPGTPHSASAPSESELLIARADSNATANATETVFRMVTDSQGAPLKVTDVAPLTGEDPNGGGLFFLLIALSVSSYISVLVLGPAAGELGMGIRAALGLGVSLAISGIGILLAGPAFGIVDHNYPAIWAMCLLFSAGVIAVGLALHTFLKQLTPLVLMGLFVVLNLTSAGGLMGPALQNGFYRSLHSFWNGAAFVEGSRSILYFHDAKLGEHITALSIWLAAGVVLTLLAARTERLRKARSQPDPEALKAAAALELAEGGWED